MTMAKVNTANTIDERLKDNGVDAYAWSRQVHNITAYDLAMVIPALHRVIRRQGSRRYRRNGTRRRGTRRIG